MQIFINKLSIVISTLFLISCNESHQCLEAQHIQEACIQHHGGGSIADHAVISSNQCQVQAEAAQVACKK